MNIEGANNLCPKEFRECNNKSIKNFTSNSFAKLTVLIIFKCQKLTVAFSYKSSRLFARSVRNISSAENSNEKKNI